MKLCFKYVRKFIDHKLQNNEDISTKSHLTRYQLKKLIFSMQHIALA